MIQEKNSSKNFLFYKQLNFFFTKINIFLNFWFVGLIILLFYFLNTYLSLNIEAVEWLIFIVVFLIIFTIFILDIFFKFEINFLFKFILSIPFYIFFFLIIEYSYVQLLYILSSILFVYYTKNKINIDFFLKTFFVFIIFNLSSKILFWQDLKDFYFYKLNISSEYIDYQYLINTIGTPLIFIIFFISIFLIINLYNNNLDTRKNLLLKFWWILPTIIFFLESFSTAKFFENQEGAMIHHWQMFVGPLELLQQGGFLLWDTPSQYGFLSILSAYIIPFNDPWIKFYFLNSSLKLISSLLIFYTIWNKKSVLRYFLSLIITFSILFIFTISPSFDNSSITPGSGPFRFFWVILIMFFIVKNKSLNLKKQLLFISPIWLIGFLWSILSAFIVSAIVFPLILYCFLENKNNYFSVLKYTLLFPFLLIFTNLFLLLYYYVNIGNFPDYYSFIEYAISWSSGSNYAQPINLYGPGFLLLTFFSFIFLLIFKQKNHYDKYIIFSILSGIWALTSYCIGTSFDEDFLRILFFYIFCYFLISNNFEVDKKNNLFFYPILILVISFSFGNPKFFRHIMGTLKNQNYFFNNIHVEENENLDYILNSIKPYPYPIAYLQPGRYTDTISFKKYYTENEKYKLHKKMWIPYNPAQMFRALNKTRSIKYISRWIERHPFKNGWLINTKNSEIDHWHREYEEYLYLSLTNYKIIKKIEYGDLKAILFERN